MSDRKEYFKQRYDEKKKLSQEPPLAAIPNEQEENFALEKHLENYLMNNWGNTEFGKEYDIYEKDGDLIGRQYQTDTGPLDILAISKDKTKFLVVELKKGKANDKAVGQTLRYMSFIRDTLARPEQKVLGAIVAFEEDKKLKRAISMVPDIKFYHYKIAASEVFVEARETLAVLSPQLPEPVTQLPQFPKPITQLPQFPKPITQLSQLLQPVKQSVSQDFNVFHSVVKMEACEISNPHVKAASPLFRYPVTTYAASFLIICFLFANSAFLVNEQVRFYEMKSYAVGYAIFLSVLAEVATIFLSFMATWQQRPIYLAVLIPTLFLILAIIFCGLDRTQDAESRKQKIVQILEKELAIIEKQGETKQVLAKIEKKQEELRKALSISGSGSTMEVWVLFFLRLLSVVWNAIFASVLASLFRKNPARQLFPQA